MIWFVGDTAILAGVTDFANAEGDDLLVSATANATAEEVWTVQKHELPRSRKPFNVTVILFLNDKDYDAELTYLHLQERAPVGSKILYCILPDSPKLVEDLMHYNATPIVLNMLSGEYVQQRLTEAANAP